MHILRQFSKTAVYGSIMASYGASFESAHNINDRKKHKRKAREEVVQKVWVPYDDTAGVWENVWFSLDVFVCATMLR